MAKRSITLNSRPAVEENTRRGTILGVIISVGMTGGVIAWLIILLHPLLSK